MDRKIKGYMTAEQIKEGNHYLSGMCDDTLSCWIATRINGRSVFEACDGNISIPLLKELDEKIKPLVENLYLSGVSNWVMCKDKLPLVSGDYLVSEDGSVFEACYYKDKNIWGDYEVTKYKDVTHWMQLPKPPCY